MNNITGRIVTAPQRFELTEGGAVLLGKAGQAMYTVKNLSSCAYAQQAEELISAKLTDILGTKAQGEGVTVILKDGAAPENTPNADQGYSISVKADEIVLTGFGPRGLLYAAVSLSQLLLMENNAVCLPAFEMVDWPDIEKRGHFIESRYGTDLMELSDWEQVIADMVQKKENTLTISVYSCWCIQFDHRVSEYIFVPIPNYPKLKTPVYTKYFSPAKKGWVDEKCDTPMAAKDFFGDICAHGKKWGVEVLPLLNSYGHNTLIPSRYPEVSAKYEDGTPTLNGFCTSEEKTYELLFDMYDTIIDRYLKPNGITSFDIGLDEVGLGDDTSGVNAEDPFTPRPAFCRCEKCRDKSPIERYISHAVRLIKHLKEKGMTSVYVYNDMLYRADRPKDRDFLPDFVKALEDNDLMDVTIIGWWKYNCQPALLEETGFNAGDIRRSKVRTIVKPMNGYYHWHMLHPSIKNSCIHGGLAKDSASIGYLSYSCWDDMYDRTNTAQAMYSWSYDKNSTVESCSRAYCARLFPTQADRAYKAFELLDLVNEEKRDIRADGTKVLSTRFLCESILSYYPYSYLRLKKRYPRNFPGEAMSTILANREETQRLIYQALGCAQAAQDIFEDIARDPLCSRYFAQIYALEAENFVCLLEDYLALLRMHDITAAGVDEDGRAELIRLSSLRKNARLAHMAKREKLKSHCNMPSQMRHQSIFMQLFADIESYAGATGAEDISLDFTDLAPIGSEQFFYIR